MQQLLAAMHEAPHGLNPALQAHWPPLQPAFCGQVVPHDPQFCVSVFVFRQIWLQHVCWDGHPACPLVQQSALAMHPFPQGLKPALQTHSPPEQVALAGQVPQEMPSPQLLVAGPHCLPEQAAASSGTQTHDPPWHVSLPVHDPHEPPQPSLPHSLPSQSASQTHVPPWHAAFPLHVPQEIVAPQLLTAGPHCLPAQAAPSFGAHTHMPP